MYCGFSLYLCHKAMMWWFVSPPLGKGGSRVSEGAKICLQLQVQSPPSPPPPAWFFFSALILSGVLVLSPGCPLPSSSLQSLSSSPQSQPPRPAELSDEEVAELFQRLAETQQEKWMLEEKVLLLPTWCALGEEAGVGALIFSQPLLMWEYVQWRGLR